MERIKVTVVCDRCGQETDSKPGSGLLLALGSTRATVDLCVDCYKFLSEEIDPVLENGRQTARAGTGKTRGPVTMMPCPDCGRSFRGRAGYALHRARTHATEVGDEHAEATG